MDETSDFTDVPAPDGGPPLRFPTRTTGQWILKTFSRTTVVERESVLTDVRLDDAGFRAQREEAYASKDTMVRDTEKGVRYLDEDEGRVPRRHRRQEARAPLRPRGLFYDGSYDYPLPNPRRVYWVDLDASKRHDQFQVLFGGILSPPRGISRGSSGLPWTSEWTFSGSRCAGRTAFFLNGEEDEAQRVKSRSFAAAFKAGVPLARHLKLTGHRRRVAPRFRRGRRNGARLSSSRRTTGSRRSRASSRGTGRAGRSRGARPGTSARSGTPGATRATRTTPRTRTPSRRGGRSSRRTSTCPASSGSGRPSGTSDRTTRTASRSTSSDSSGARRCGASVRRAPRRGSDHVEGRVRLRDRERRSGSRRSTKTRG